MYNSICATGSVRPVRPGYPFYPNRNKISPYAGRLAGLSRLPVTHSRINHSTAKLSLRQGGAGGDTGLPLPVRSPRDGTAKRIVERTTGEGREKERVQRDLVGRGEVPSKRRRVVPAPRTYSANLRIHEDERASERANLGVRLPLEADIRTIEEPEANIHDKRPEINDPLKRS
ncbi:hypothetical protein ALC57_05795 [Trachymyrmex cornetzi]|uniref:Uncharacterized protein n=1 Tax=Trachymyrmex cornetzi TaxID=471704 RepID=A0A151JA17_9HYME|nr:hypothetical protein ALC57_05795 [Trachymyrmex cornetzi]